MADATVDATLFQVPTDAPVALLDCKEAFQTLTPQEKKYAHYIAKASFEGSKICLIQCSHESPAIFSLLQLAYSSQNIEELKAAAVAAGVSDEDVKKALVYSAAFLSNMGNYKSFGDSKIIPAVGAEAFKKFLMSSKGDKDRLEELWNAVEGPMYSLAPNVRSLGFPSDGVTTYYSNNCGKSDGEFIQGFLDKQNISGYNTRLFKDGENYIVKIASSEEKSEEHEYEGRKIKVEYGDYGPIMKRIVEALQEAVNFAANDEQTSMLKKYISSFSTGSIADHKDGSRHWIRDKGPVVESYIGFIESYRDPLGVRGEWEGFAAVVNKKTSAKFSSLVSAAEELISELPWPKAYEKDTFLRPDFTSLEVLGFGSSGIPAGINIPNYDEIRQEEGFKNVSLGNVLSASLAFPKDEKVTFLSDVDQDVYKRTVGDSFDVQVGLHELLGHGSGKLFRQNEDESFNFPKETTNPCASNAVVASWYTGKETWDSKFSTIGSSYEECRAECVGLFLCANKQVLGIYGHDEARGAEVTYVNWLHMARAGVLALQYYNADTKGWGQAHMMARYAILQVLLEAGKGFVEVKKGNSAEETTVTLDKEKIQSVGLPAIGAYLQKLQIYKSTADYPAGKAMYDKYTAVNDEMLSLRDQVIAARKPRRMFVQHVTSVSEDDVKLQTFSPDHEGLVSSFVARFPAFDAEMYQLWTKDAQHTTPAI